MNALARTLSVLSVLVATTLSQAQPFYENWLQTSPIVPSETQGGGLTSANKSVHVTRTATGLSVVALNSDGSSLWTVALPLGNLHSLLTTNDGWIYLTVQKDSGNASLYALDVLGALRWTFDYDIGKAPNRRLGEMRIFGDYLMVAGRGRIGGTATDPRTVVMSFNRFTGVMSWMRELLIGGVNIWETQYLRSAGNYAYVMATRNSATGISKISPVDGTEIGSYVASPFYARDFQVDSAGSIYATGYSAYLTLGLQPETRKINGSGTGTFPLTFRKSIGGDQLLLSSGAMVLRERFSNAQSLRKSRGSDGVDVWLRPIPSTQDIDALRADALGRIYMLMNNQDTGTGASWGINLVDPATGSDIASYPVATSLPGISGTRAKGLVLNSYGEILATGAVGEAGGTRGIATRLYQAPIAVDDTYTCVQGKSITTSGNGVLANDKFANPLACTVTRVSNSGPSKGTVTMSANGEFTYSATDYYGVPSGPQTFRYRITRGSITAEGTVTINVIRALSDLRLSRYVTAGNSSFGGTVYISSAEPPAAAVVLTDDSPYVTVPTSVVVPNNQSSRAFAMSAVEVSATAMAQIRASYGGVSITRTLQLDPIGLGTFTMPYSIVGGNNAFVQISLNASATSPITVQLESDSAYFPVPPSITFPVGESYAGINVTTVHPTTVKVAHVTASQGGKSITRTISIKP